MFTDSQMEYRKIIITRLWLAISMTGFPNILERQARVATEENEISFIQIYNPT
jgi:hypothetical protein